MKNSINEYIEENPHEFDQNIAGKFLMSICVILLSMVQNESVNYDFLK